MKDLEEQCVCVKFCFKLGKTFLETFQMLQQAYGEDCLSHMRCHEWYQRFKLGRTSIEDNPKSGWPSKSMDDDHVEKVRAVIHENHRLTVREVSEEVGICKSSCHTILTEKLKMHCVAAKFGMHLPTESVKFWRSMRPSVIPQLPYSPHLAPANFCLFPKLKSTPKSRQLQMVDEIKENSLQDLRAIPQNTFQDWKNAGSSVSTVKGSTLKETRLIKL
jgi:hypothetical protein